MSVRFIATLAFAALLALTAIGRASAISKEDKAKIEESLKSYFSSVPTEKEKAAHVEKLRASDQEYLRERIVPFLKEKETREATWDLLSSLRLQSFEKVAQDQLGREERARPLDYLFAVGDGDGISEAIKIWKKSEPDSEAFKTIDARLHNLYCGDKALAELVKVLNRKKSSDHHKETARLSISKQYGIDVTEFKVKEVGNYHRRFVPVIKAKHSVKGIDLLQRLTSRGEHRYFGDALVIEHQKKERDKRGAETAFELAIPDGLLDENYAVSVYVYCEKETASPVVSFMAGKTNCKLSTRDGQWRYDNEYVVATQFAKFKKATWHHLVFVSNVGKNKSEANRVDLYVDSVKMLSSSLQAKDAFSSFRISVSDGLMAISALDLRNGVLRENVVGK